MVLGRSVVALWSLGGFFHMDFGISRRFKSSRFLSISSMTVSCTHPERRGPDPDSPRIVLLFRPRKAPMIQEPMRDKVLLGALLCRCDMYSACGRCCLEQTVGIDADPSAAGDDDDDDAADDDADDDDDDHDEAEGRRRRR